MNFKREAVSDVMGITFNLITLTLISFAFGFYVSQASTCIYHQIKRFAKHRKEREIQIIIGSSGVLATFALFAFLTTISQACMGTLAIFEGGYDPSTVNVTRAQYFSLAFLVVIANGFMLYRTFLIWKLNKYALVLPALSFGATLVAGVIFLNQASHISASNLQNMVFPNPQKFVAISVAASGVCSVMIAVQLQTHRRQQLSDGLEALPYTGPIALFVESSLLYVGVGIGYLSVTGTIATIVMASLYLSSAAIAPNLICMRISDGTAAGLTSRVSQLGITGSRLSRTMGGRPMKQIKKFQGEKNVKPAPAPAPNSQLHDSIMLDLPVHSGTASESTHV